MLTASYEQLLKGNGIKAKAYKECKIGGKYLLPVNTASVGEMPRYREVIKRRCTCVWKNKHFGVFRTPKGYNITFLWHDFWKHFGGAT